uniref:Uncharacterized protein n=1 Tax=Triticum urartu TaxID=4572 RepID=A0A8R7TVI7_TRIUA
PSPSHPPTPPPAPTHAAPFSPIPISPSEPSLFFPSLPISSSAPLGGPHLVARSLHNLLPWPPLAPLKPSARLGLLRQVPWPPPLCSQPLAAA